MLFVHEVHRVAGPCEEEFEAAFRDELVPALGEGSEARLVWYLRQAHGTGPSYSVVSMTAVRDGASLERLGQRMTSGDLSAWAARVDGMRHGGEAKVLVPLAWSPLPEIELSEVPTDGREHEPTLYMEDTAWPFRGRMQDYLGKVESLYASTIERSRSTGRGVLEIEAAFRPLFGTHQAREIVLWQRIASHEALIRLLAFETPPAHKAPGTWMHDALEVRDRWESRLLRTVAWSPRH